MQSHLQPQSELQLGFVHARRAFDADKPPQITPEKYSQSPLIAPLALIAETPRVPKTKRAHIRQTLLCPV
ncbi:hypothetical protein BH10CYA1_BH10CYA1_56870 [soil metagenome]